MNRRAFLAAPVALFAQEPNALKFGEPIQRGDTTILLMREPDAPEGEFSVGVQSKTGDQALVQVFYETSAPGIGKLLLHHEAAAPVVSGWGFGATNLFHIPPGSLRMIRVKLFTTRATVEFR